MAETSPALADAFGAILDDRERALDVPGVRAAMEAMVKERGVADRDPAGNTALHALAMAEWYRDESLPAVVEAARVLLEAGADVRARNAEGLLPLDVAVLEVNLPELVELLLSRGGAPETERERQLFLDRYRELYDDNVDWDVDVVEGPDGPSSEYVCSMPDGFRDRQDRIVDALRAHGGPLFESLDVDQW